MSVSGVLVDNKYEPISELCVKQTDITHPKYPVIDMHTHFGPMLRGDGYVDMYDTAETVEKLKKAGVRKVLTLELLWEKGYDRLLEKIHPYEDFILSFGSVDYSRLDEPGFESMVWKTVNDLKSKGAKGLKIWKDLTFYMKDKSDQYIPVDDKRLQCIWQASAELDMPILIHIGDPPPFFKPVDRFNEGYESLVDHPEWSFTEPGMFNFEQLMEQQQHLLEENPDTTFVIAHVGSYAENLEFVGKCMDRYPNMYTDIAARLYQLGRQPYTAKKFFEKYADRIMFGTDYMAGGNPEDTYPAHYRFLETFDEYFEHPDGNLGWWRIYGIGLSDDILKKIYYENAERILKL
ncbi:MAG: amidohydrolase family protein [Caldicoprobacterales bacterium]|jgi:predicted TIM-barrel fold metal-dependent hydrolase|nr:amidohydrolase family protein [Clostridiales bacterium]